MEHATKIATKKVWQNAAGDTLIEDGLSKEASSLVATGGQRVATILLKGFKNADKFFVDPDKHTGPVVGEHRLVRAGHLVSTATSQEIEKHHATLEDDQSEKKAHTTTPGESSVKILPATPAPTSPQRAAAPAAIAKPVLGKKVKTGKKK